MKKIVCLLVALTMLALLPMISGCGGVDEELPVRVWTLNGTTGFGMAQLMDANTKNEAALNYEFEIKASPEEMRNALLVGSVDICALSTNTAAMIYNKTEGEILLLALNTGGVLYLVTNSANVATPPTSLADLSGKTVYCPKAPSYIPQALLDKAGLTDVTLDTSKAQPAAVRTALENGEIDYAILPEPMVTIAKAKAAQSGISLHVSLDLTAEWEKHYPADSLVQGCIVARKAFVEEHPKEVAKFMEEYEASVNYAIQNPAEAAQMIAAVGIFEQATVAQKALPNCNLCFITGTDMKNAMQAFLAAVPLSEIGDALPDDAFYYIP